MLALLWNGYHSAARSLLENVCPDPDVLNDPPLSDGPYEFFRRFDAQCEQPNFLRRTHADVLEETLQFGEFEFGGCEISADNPKFFMTR